MSPPEHHAVAQTSLTESEQAAFQHSLPSVDKNHSLLEVPRFPHLHMNAGSSGMNPWLVVRPPALCSLKEGLQHFALTVSSLALSLLLLLNRVSRCSPGCLGTRHTEQTGYEPIEICQPWPLLELKVCTTSSGSYSQFSMPGFQLSSHLLCFTPQQSSKD